MFSSVCAPRFRRYVIACLVIPLLVICGCTDLDEITQFAKASQSVGSAFPRIAEQAAASCIQANSFINAQNPVTPLNCEIYPALTPSLLKVNAALFNYIASLGKLASDDLSKVAGGFDKLSADLKQADPGISKESQSKASAAADLAKAITNIWANGYRQHALSKIIGENNKAVQDVTEFLSDYAAAKYRQSLEHKAGYERSFCDIMKNPATEPIASDLLARKCAADQAQTDVQLKAIQSYQAALATIAKTHDTLNQERGHWDAKQLSRDLGPEIVSLGNAAVAMNNAF